MGKFSLRNLFKTGLKEETFNSLQFQKEALAYASWQFEKNNKSYDHTRKSLTELKLNEIQKDTVITWLKNWHFLEVQKEVLKSLTQEAQRLINEGKHQQAFNLVFASLEENKNDIGFLELLVQISDTYKTEREVLEQFDKLKVLIQGQEYNVEYRKALYLKSKSRFEEAKNLFTELNTRLEFGWNYYQMAIMENLQGNTAACLNLLEKTFEVDPQPERGC